MRCPRLLPLLLLPLVLFTLPPPALPFSPPFIIGGALRKLRGDGEKVPMPVASAEEASGEAPGLRVGEGAWKWPASYPYDAGYFQRPDQEPRASPMALINQGMNPDAAAPSPTSAAASAAAARAFWETSEPETAGISPASLAALAAHHGFYMSAAAAERGPLRVLEFGPGESSHLPPGLPLERHVGVGITDTYARANPSLTEFIAADLNDVDGSAPGGAINSEELAALPAGEFDFVIMSNVADFLTAPLSVYRAAHSLLRPGGLMLVSFAGRSYQKPFEGASTRLWRTMSDDQKLWVCG
ncbi:hypothetical protein TeGR_g8570, partial [Tetraparma gracilis]